MTKGSDPYFSKTIEKGLIILNLFDRDHTSRRLSEIAMDPGCLMIFIAHAPMA